MVCPLGSPGSASTADVPFSRLMSPDFRQVFDKSPFACAVLSAELVILACNDAFQRNAGRTRDSMLSRFIFDVFPDEAGSQQELLEMSFAEVRRHGRPDQIPLLRYPIRQKTAGQDKYEDRYWTISNIPLMDDTGTVRFILHYPTDITDLTRLRQTPLQSNQDGLLSDSEQLLDASHWAKTVQEILHVERDRLQRLFQQAPGFICVLRGPEHIFELANDAYYQLIGHRKTLGYVLADVLPEVVAQGFLEKLDRVLATGEPFIGRALPIELQRVAGGPLEQRYIDLVYQPIRDSTGQVSGIFVQGHDVTEAHELAREVAYQAAHDPLTGLYNRREFARQTAALDAQSGSHALLYMDLDHFKIVNDRCGHAAGDALLLQAASVLRQHIGDEDLLARLGGDEFALVLRDCAEPAALELAHVLRRKIRDIPFVWGTRRYSVTLSVGLAGFGSAQGLSFDEAFSLADAACFLAKEKGRNRVQVSHANDEEVGRQQRDMDWTARIKDCIVDDRVVLHAQRLVAMTAQPPDGVECREILARLLDADGKLVFPGSFIPAAERFGLIYKLDRHIIRKSFAMLQRLPENQRARTRYFINVSGVTLSTPSLSAYIAELLAEHPDVKPHHLCFEVTETAAVSHLGQTADAMRHLVAQGFSFALDDFGSGMSSFAYLDQLPVQYLKIDGDLIKGMLTRPAGAAIVEAVVKVARAMNLMTVAESVESVEWLPYLREIGIDYGQGFALHRPEPL